MDISYLLSCLFARKGIVRFVTCLLLFTPALVSIVRPNSAYGNPSNLVGLTVHNDKSGQTNYIMITRDESDPYAPAFCQSVPPLNWVDVESSPDVLAILRAGQIIWLKYFHSPKCDPSSNFMSVGLPIPAMPVENHCWFNPDNTNTPNWSGCVNPSQILPINWSPSVDTSALENHIRGEGQQTSSRVSDLQGQQSRIEMNQVAKKILEKASQLIAGVLAVTQLFVQTLPLVHAINNKHIDSNTLLT